MVTGDGLAIAQLMRALETDLVDAALIGTATILKNFNTHNFKAMVEVMGDVVAFSSQVRMHIVSTCRHVFGHITSNGSFKRCNKSISIRRW